MANQISRRRHWKQRWDPDAKFIYRRALKLSDPETGKAFRVLVGDDVDSEFWGRGRLRRLWDQAAIELKDFEPPVVIYGRAAGEAPVAPAAPEEAHGYEESPETEKPVADSVEAPAGSQETQEEATVEEAKPARRRRKKRGSQGE